MAKIVIKKRVPLDFLGEDYKDAYLVFRSFPVSDFDALLNRVLEAEKKKKSVSETLDILKEYFITGEFPGDSGKLETLSKDDLDGLNGEALQTCFALLSGQTIDPKSEAPLTNQSTTGPENQPS